MITLICGILKYNNIFLKKIRFVITKGGDGRWGDYMMVIKSYELLVVKSINMGNVTYNMMIKANPAG